jgi:hypothetical protein
VRDALAEGGKLAEVVARAQALLAESSPSSEPIDSGFVQGVINSLKKDDNPHGKLTITGEKRDYTYKFKSKKA